MRRHRVFGAVIRDRTTGTWLWGRTQLEWLQPLAAPSKRRQRQDPAAFQRAGAGAQIALSSKCWAPLSSGACFCEATLGQQQARAWRAHAAAASLSAPAVKHADTGPVQCSGLAAAAAMRVAATVTAADPKVPRALFNDAPTR